MLLTEWEVWLTYSMYLSGEVGDLRHAAESLVQSGLTDVAATSDGVAVFRSGGKLKTGHLDVSLSPDRRQARVTLPEDASGFVAEGLVQTAMMRFSELRLFDDESPIAPPYVRAQLGECWAYSEEGATRFYPSLKLFQNGVVLVELRMFSPEQSTSLPDFIGGVVNGYALPFERVETSVGLASLLPRAVLLREQLPFMSRLRIQGGLRAWEAEVRQQARITDSENFHFEVAEIEPETLRPHTTNEFAHLVAAAASYAVSSPREGASHLLRGPGPTLQVEGPWVGRPHVHLIRFEDQQATASENEIRHGDSLGWIMARHAGDNSDEGRAHLPRSLRQFDDYGAYVSGALTLWVQSLRSIERSMHSPGDQRRLAEAVYEQQVTAEMLDYGYMIHKRFAQRASTEAVSTEQVLAAQRDLVRLEGAMKEVGRSGELRNLLDSAWTTLGVGRLQETAARGLAVRQTEAANLEARRVQRWGTALALVLGVGVVPSVANEVLSPIWKWVPLPAPTDTTTGKIMLLAVAGVLVAGLLWSLRRWTLR